MNTGSDQSPTTPDDAQPRRHTIPPEWDGMRLDRIMCDLIPDQSRSRLGTWIRSGEVQVDGEVVERTSHLVRTGNVVEFLPPGDLRRSGGLLPIRVIHEDEHLALIDKPAGVVCHPSVAIVGGTVSEQAVALFGPLPDPHADRANERAAELAHEAHEAHEGDEEEAEVAASLSARPGIVHRLDSRTTGIMVVARTAAAGDSLVKQFADRRVKKTYLALVHGEPRFISDWITESLVRDPRQPDRMSVAREGEGRDAETFYEVLERFDGFALVSAKPVTGRTHQIRVHFESIEHPIVGDTVYKGRRRRQSLPKGAPKMDRQALHAWKLELEHPATGETLSGEAPVPEDMRVLVEWMRENRPKG